jgi:undecaprenyl-diphosphatase
MEAFITFSKGIIHAHGYIGIFSLTTLEQFIFPVPADIFIAMGTSNGLIFSRILFMVLLGALIGSSIGYVLGKYLGHPAATWIFGKKRMEKGEQFIKKWGIWGVIVAGLTPLPFKIVTWMSGIFEMPFRKFILGVIIGRMPRYIISAYAGTWLYETKFYATTDMSALILGAMQGLTEFLPISSSGHLVILESFLKLPIPESQMITFDIFLHGGSLIAILAYFWKDWFMVLKEIGQMIRRLKIKTDSLTFKLAIGTIPAILAGLLFKDGIENHLRQLHFVAIFMMLIGLVYFYAAWKGKKNHEEKIGLKKAIMIGLAQSCALIPGISRSGATIATGVTMGLTRKAAARFSFMLGAVAILAANVYALLTLDGSVLPDGKFIAIGTITSFLTSFAAIYILLRFLQKHTMRAFGVYLLIIGSLILSFL